MVVAFLSSCILKTNVCVKKNNNKKNPVSILPLITITQMTKNQEEKKNIEIVNVIETV